MEKRTEKEIKEKPEEREWEKSLYERLLSYGCSDYAAFHMPGHKRQVKTASLPEGLPWQIDITEIDGFDNLHYAQGILRESMDKAASFYGVKKTFYSINGSTAGILSAVFAVTKPGDTILMGRNCHKSVYHAVFLRNLRPLYLYPQIEKSAGIGCGYSPEELENMLKTHPDIKAVVLTSPTYEGVISDIRTIAKQVHKRGIPLIVDEAHGAHLSVGEEEKAVTGFPLSAVCLGADLVIQSLHKTLPALTQTALLHVCGDLVSEQEAGRYMSIFQTSSPSYVLMASIDSCLRYRMSEEGIKESGKFGQRLRELRERLKQYRRIRLIHPASRLNETLDPSKLVLAAEGMSGKELYDLLRVDYHLQPEMCTGHYVLLMTSMFDTKEMYDRLCSALQSIEEQISKKEDVNGGENEKRCLLCPAGTQIFTPSQADLLATEEVDLKDSVGCVSAEYAYQYPPGIPLLVPGEKISKEVLECLLEEAEAGLEIQGLKDSAAHRILVIRS